MTYKSKIALAAKKTVDRRCFMVSGMSAVSGIVLPVSLLAKVNGVVTPQQTEGPFYPVQDQADKDVDLTHVEGYDKPAQGKVIRVTGIVYDQSGNILKNAFVEIWQANSVGRYRHPRDPSSAPLDPGFQGWGQTRTSEQGQYGFKTIMPAAYPAGRGWIRPPHIHFKINMPGYRRLTTQMYFPGHELNSKDLILQNLPPEQQSLVVSKQRAESAAKDANPVFEFNVYLQKT